MSRDIAVFNSDTLCHTRQVIKILPKIIFSLIKPQLWIFHAKMIYLLVALLEAALCITLRSILWGFFYSHTSYHLLLIQLAFLPFMPKINGRFFSSYQTGLVLIPSMPCFHATIISCVHNKVMESSGDEDLVERVFLEEGDFSLTAKVSWEPQPPHRRRKGRMKAG